VPHPTSVTAATAPAIAGRRADFRAMSILLDSDGTARVTEIDFKVKKM